MSRYVTAAEVRKVLQIHSSTLRGWAEQGKLDCKRMPGGKRLYNQQQLSQLVGHECEVPARAKIVYARVSSQHQKADLDRQIQDLQQAYPNHEVVKDIASGLNWKRPGLLSLLERVCSDSVEEVVVAYRDRLCRFGLELLEWLFSKHQVRLVVHSKMETTPDPSRELAEDLLAVANFFVAKNNGKRAGEKRCALSFVGFDWCKLLIDRYLFIHRRAREKAKQRSDEAERGRKRQRTSEQEQKSEQEAQASSIQESQGSAGDNFSTASASQEVAGSLSLDLQQVL
jgi:predicted site-specific integrase-resolvase